jgi:hypothetical protein
MKINPTLIAMMQRFKVLHSFSNNNTTEAAKQAVNDVEPKAGMLYPEEQHRIDQVKVLQEVPPYWKPEVKFSACICLLGLAIAILPMVFFGLTNFSLLLIAIGAIICASGFHETVLKDYPSVVTKTTLTEAKTQLNESGEGKLKTIGVVGTAGILVASMVESAVTTEAAVTILGRSSMTPNTVRMVAISITVLLAYGLYFAMKSAAKEHRENHARKTIRDLEKTDTTLANAMKKRLGPALDQSFAPQHDSKTKQRWFWGMFAVLSVLSLGLRVGTLMMPSETDSPAEQMSISTPR